MIIPTSPQENNYLIIIAQSAMGCREQETFLMGFPPISLHKKVTKRSSHTSPREQARKERCPSLAQCQLLKPRSSLITYSRCKKPMIKTAPRLSSYSSSRKSRRAFHCVRPNSGYQPTPKRPIPRHLRHLQSGIFCDFWIWMPFCRWRQRARAKNTGMTPRVFLV